MKTVITPRESKYCESIRSVIRQHGHVTNATILADLHKTYPDLSATTIHRATARLAHRGEIKTAPPDPQGSMRYDANTNEHDHFMCSSCGKLRDVDIADYIRPLIESQLEGCHISGRITISGTCQICAHNREEL